SSSVCGAITQSIAPPTRKLVKSAKRFPRSARTPNRAAISSTWSILLTLLFPRAQCLLFQQPEQLLTHAIHRSRSERQHEITRLHMLAQNRGGVIEWANVVRVLVTETLDRRSQRF